MVTDDGMFHVNEPSFVVEEMSVCTRLPLWRSWTPTLLTTPVVVQRTVTAVPIVTPPDVSGVSVTVSTDGCARILNDDEHAFNDDASCLTHTVYPDPPLCESGTKTLCAPSLGVDETSVTGFSRRPQG